MMLDALNYGNTSQKYIDMVKRQSEDMGTVLGVHMSMVNRPCPIPPPPPNGGTDTLLELNAVVERQVNSSDDDRGYAISMDEFKNHYEMWATEATKATKEKYDYDFFFRIGTCIEGFLNYMKIKYDRPRPYQLAPIMGKRVDLFINEPGTASYPSGHAMDAWTFAGILCRRHPQHSNKFRSIADRVCDSRVVGGAHFPSDLKAGKMLAEYAIHIIDTRGLMKGML